ncbi:uncharacterized protein LOC124533766 [Vanessa cardui]|uniref:uncharacterized protein LOC124533766 n=1 Tax=Vanessa cardui TaxID=171605 RepID=UPI001F143C1B|nr:uncharacterized protein LOC124533766 [Vanessa cardui]
MKLVPVDLLKQKRLSISSFVRNTSCSRGWLRWLVQIIFGTLIVSSFILIVLMALNSSHRATLRNSRCTVVNCRVICNDAPFYGNYENDIVNAAAEVDPNCESIALQLNRPTFENSKVPEHWLSSIRSHVRELAIIGGNIKYIPSYAFMTPFSNNLRTLILEKIEINHWENDMLIGLSSLKKLYIKNCILNDIQKHALRIVDESLQFLDIKATNDFNPTNLTGSAKLESLTVVDFSLNNFYNILQYRSFSKLNYCKVLFLNSCRITSLGPGTFDNLNSIEVLYLNDNNLVTVPVGLFNKIIPLEPRIALQENIWHCDCSSKDLRNVFNSGLLIDDPICRYPHTLNGMTFSDLEGYCKEVVDQNGIVYNPKTNPCKNISNVMYMNDACSETNSTNDKVRTVSRGRTCLLNRINSNELNLSSDNIGDEIRPVWIKPVYSVRSDIHSMVEMVLSEQPGLGLLWYQSLCFKEVFCTNTIPQVLKIFNIDSDVSYTFCPFNLTNEKVLRHQCVSFNFLDTTSNYASNNYELILYICISLGCLLCGAVSVYVIIQRYPNLLKGNKRVILVKHKSIEALILPPKLPKRKNFLSEPKPITSHVYEKKKIFLLSDNIDRLSPKNFARSISMRSCDSNDASYISALPPTEEQINEWRSNQSVDQFDNIPMSDSDTSPFYSIFDQDSLPYYSIQTCERFYEVPKQY